MTLLLKECLSGAEPDNHMKPFSLEPYCEKLSEPSSGAESNIELSSMEIPCEELIKEKPLPRFESNININFAFTKNLCEELFKEKYVSRVKLDIDTKPSLKGKSCDLLLVIKHQDEHIKQLYWEQKQEKYNKK